MPLLNNLTQGVLPTGKTLCFYHSAMKTHVLLALLLVSSNLLFAQYIQFKWQNCFNNPLYDNASDIVATGDGYLLVGSSLISPPIPPDVYDNDIWLIKIGLDGEFIWQKMLGGSNSDEPVQIVPSSDGNYFIIAVSTSYDGDIASNPYPTSSNFWIVKIDGEGNIIWERITGGNGGDISYRGTPTLDGGILAIGWTTSSDGDISQYFGSYDLWLVKLDSLGGKVWDFTAGTAGAEFGQAVIETSDKGALAGGATLMIGGGNIECIPHAETADAILFKLDSTGNVQWQHCYGGSDYEGIIALLEVEDGYIFGAYATSNDGDVAGSGYHEGYNHLGDNTHDIWMVKVDFNGNIIWSKCFGGSREEYVHKIFQTSDGNLVAFGTTNSFDGDVVGNHSIPGHHDIWMFKVSSSGNLIWQRSIGGIGDELINPGVIQVSDADYAVVSSIEGGSNDDITCGNYPEINWGIWACGITDTTFVGLPDYDKISENIGLYPNPATDYLFVDIPKEFSLQHAVLQVVDANGKIVMEQKTLSYTLQLNVGQHKPGLYLLKLTNEKVFATKRFIVD